jgi:hypothetical protein
VSVALAFTPAILAAVLVAAGALGLRVTSSSLRHPQPPRPRPTSSTAPKGGGTHSAALRLFIAPKRARGGVAVSNRPVTAGEA